MGEDTCQYTTGKDILHRVGRSSLREDWNGALAAPTLINTDADPDLEVISDTAHSGIVAYDIPGTSQAEIHWGTGRENFHRDGYQP